MASDYADMTNKELEQLLDIMAFTMSYNVPFRHREYCSNAWIEINKIKEKRKSKQ